MIAGRNPAIDVAIITNAIPTKKEKGRKQKGKAIETDLQKKESEHRTVYSARREADLVMTSIGNIEPSCLISEKISEKYH
jgi:hypothetical protein